MPFKIIFTDSYTKRAVKFIKKHPELKRQYHKTLLLLEADPHHPALRLHKLKGKLKDLHSISINIKYRVTIELLIEENHIILIDIGSHEEAY